MDRYIYIYIYCDNLDALCKNKPNPTLLSYPRFFRPNMDLKILLWDLRKDKPPKLNIFLEHIKGHQDRNSTFDYDSAPKSVQLNIEMDHRSRKFLQNHQGKPEPQQIPLPPPTQQAYLTLSSTLVPNNINHHATLHFFGSKMESRLQRVSGLNKDERAQIHWRAFEWAYKRLSVVARLPIFKLIHNKWSPAMEIAKFDPEKDPICQRCGLHPETFRHIFQCPSNHALNSHKTAISKLRKTLQKQDTTPIITEAIIQLLAHSRKGYCDLNLRNVIATDEMRELTRNTMTHQLSIGITYFLQGYLTKHWVVIQNISRK